MRVLITGSRYWVDYAPIYRVLKILHTNFPDTIIVHGAAKGADRIAGELAGHLFGTSHVERYPADWEQYGKSAGPIRNRLMVSESFRLAKDDGHDLKYGIAFHEDVERSKGTKDMVSVLEYHGIPVLRIPGDGIR